MAKKLHVACSPLTGTIFAGTVLRDGRTWGANTQDVTIAAMHRAACTEDDCKLDGGYAHEIAFCAQQTGEES